MYRNWKKNLLNSNISSKCPHNVMNLGPLTAEIGSVVWGIPANFNRFCILASLLQWCCSPEANQTAWNLAISWAGTLYVHFRGLLSRQNFARCKIHFASKSCLLLYWQHYCTALQQLGQPNFAAWYKEWNYGTFT